ncbi:hypothetical protein TFLX_03124 [Thermoflexales bacterium]|nr:hypothetical protein TFLX_03124 [Thermoflexales bacterium]
MLNIDPVLLAMLVPAILGLVNFLKDMGVAGKALTVVSMIIGIVFVVGAQVLDAALAKLILTGILGGLAASGLYDFGKLVGGGAAR